MQSKQCKVSQSVDDTIRGSLAFFAQLCKTTAVWVMQIRDCLKLGNWVLAGGGGGGGGREERKKSCNHNSNPSPLVVAHRFSCLRKESIVDVEGKVAGGGGGGGGMAWWVEGGVEGTREM